jgi:hypothetical protein
MMVGCCAVAGTPNHIIQMAAQSDARTMNLKSKLKAILVVRVSSAAGRTISTGPAERVVCLEVSREIRTPDPHTCFR